MSIWLNILIDIGVLAFIGLLYYFYQKRRIIRVSHEMILYDLNDFRFKLNEFIEKNATHPQLEHLQDLATNIDQIYETQQFDSFHQLLDYQNTLPEELSKTLLALDSQIKDHLISK